MKVGYLKSYIVSILLALSAVCQAVQAQEPDGIFVENISTDTIRVFSVNTTNVVSAGNLEKAKFSPDPTKAVLFSAIFPGLGQVYNRKYWKLPIVYGGFMGCAYAISFNARYYKDYSNAYLDFTDGNPNTNSWQDFLPYNYQLSDDAWFAGVLKRKKDYYRKYRDMSYIIAVGLYALCMVDAYVDAQLFDFDISQDLSFRIEPTFFDRTNYNQRSFGLQCSFSF